MEKTHFNNSDATNNFSSIYMTNKTEQHKSESNTTKIINTSINLLPNTIEQFLKGNYGQYNIDQILVHKEGPEVLSYEIGVASVYEYTLHFNANGEFNKVDLIED